MSNHIITSRTHSFDALKKMRSLKEKQSLCDINIKIGDISIAAHKVVLASSSPYFEFMFTGKVTENGKADIELRDLCPEAVLALIDYVYSGFLVVNDETIFKMLKAADFMQITSAKEECLRFLQKNINAPNCIAIKYLAKKHFFTELEEKVNNFIRWNFLEVCQTQAFLKFTLGELKDFLSDSSFCLMVSSSQEGICSWIQYDKASRERFQNELSTFVSGIAASMPQREQDLYDAHRQKRMYIFDENECYMNVAFVDLSKSTLHRAPSRPKLNKFSCVSVKNSIFLIDTFEGTCCQYDSDTEKWTMDELASTGSFHSRACNVQDRIFLVAECSSKKAYSFDFEKNVLYTQPSLIYKRIYPGVSLSGNCVYVCGGSCNSAERLDIRTKAWRSIAQISGNSLGRCSVASLGDFVYCAGVDQSSFNKYDPRNGKWITLPGIPNSGNGSYTSLSSSDDTLYAVNRKGIYQYSLNINAWSTISCSMYSSYPPTYPTCLFFAPE